MSTYLDEHAAAIKDQVDEAATPPPDSEYLFVLYAVLLRVKGASVTSADVHDAWSAWMQLTNPDHKALKPFEQLEPQTQREDDVYAEAIRRAHRLMCDSDGSGADRS